MPTSPFIDANGATAYRGVRGTGTQADPYISQIEVIALPESATGDRFLLIPKAPTDISVTTSLTPILTLDVKALKTVSLTIRNLGTTNPLTSFVISGTRGISYNQLSVLASTDGDYTTLLGVSLGNQYARVIEASVNPRTLAFSTDTSLVINVADIVSLVLSSTSAGTTVNYEAIGVLL